MPLVILMMGVNVQSETMTEMMMKAELYQCNDGSAALSVEYSTNLCRMS